MVSMELFEGLCQAHGANESIKIWTKKKAISKLGVGEKIMNCDV